MFCTASPLHNPSPSPCVHTFLQLDMTGRTPETRTADGWLKYTIPMGDFDCPAPEGMNQLGWELKGGVKSNVAMCLDEVRINRGGGGGGKAANTKPAASELDKCYWVTLLRNRTDS